MPCVQLGCPNFSVSPSNRFFTVGAPDASNDTLRPTAMTLESPGGGKKRRKPCLQWGLCHCALRRNSQTSLLVTMELVPRKKVAFGLDPVHAVMSQDALRLGWCHANRNSQAIRCSGLVGDTIRTHNNRHQ